MIELVQGLYDIGLLGLVRIAVDFLIIAAGALAILRTMRFTVGMPLLLSIGTMGVLYLLVRLGGLQATRSIFEGSTQWLAFTFVVLFQDDIRRLVLKANPSDLVARFLGTTTDTKANEQLMRVVIDTSQDLIAQKLGALIVIDRKNDLVDYTASAVELDAVLTRELLYSVFIPTHGNPLHDGAAVLTPSRIVAAGAFLPLTTNSDIDLLMGTRHRAGIGLSEVSGALVIIVSEERQTLTICEDGRYQRFDGDKIDAFRGELQRRLSPRGKAVAVRGTTKKKGA